MPQPKPEVVDSQTEAKDRKRYFLLMLFAAVSAALGLTLLTWWVSTALAQSFGVAGFPRGVWLHPLAIAGAGLTLLGAIFVLLALLSSQSIMVREALSVKEQLRQYNVALVGMGFALVLIGTLNFVALAGLSSIGELEPLLGGSASMANEPEFRGSGPVATGTIRMLFLPGFAALGGLFFVAGSLRRKRAALQAIIGSQPFDYLRFWGGLVYRIGEAVLFALVIFLTVSSGLIEVPESSRTWLLLMALLMGMFVKPAEQMINGLALRSFEGVTAFLRMSPPAADRPQGEARDQGEEGEESAEGEAEAEAEAAPAIPRPTDAARPGEATPSRTD